MTTGARKSLRQRLIQLFDNPRTIQRIVSDAGIVGARINWQGNVVDIWEEILTEAQNTDQITALVEVAAAEYPNHGAHLRQWLQIIQGEGNSASISAASAGHSSEHSHNAGENSAASRVTEQTIVEPGREIPIDNPSRLRLSVMETRLLSTLFGRATKLEIKSEFTDGRTATRVFLVHPIDGVGRAELPAVAKVGPLKLIESEWRAAEGHVLNRLSGFAPVQGRPIFLDGHVDGDDDSTTNRNRDIRWGALRYQQVGDGLYPVTSLAQYANAASITNIWHLLQRRLFVQLRNFWQGAQEWQIFTIGQSYDAILPVNLTVMPLPLDPQAVPDTLLLDAKQGIDTAQIARLQNGMLVHLANFVVIEIDEGAKEITLDLPQSNNGLAGGFRVRIQQTEHAPPAIVEEPYPALVGTVADTRRELLQQRAQSQLENTIDLSATTIRLPSLPSVDLPNPLLVLPQLLNEQSEGWFATIHGDLNLRNILVEPGARTAHIIDCASAHHDHILHDLLRMERDTITDLLPALCFRHQMSPTIIVSFYQQLHCALQGNIHAEGEFALPHNLAEELIPLFIMIATIRQNARQFLEDSSRWDDYYRGLCIHLTGALKFRDLYSPAPGQKPIALAFWGAATIADLLQNREVGQERCRQIEWRHFHVEQGHSPTMQTGRSPERADPKHNVTGDATQSVQPTTHSATSADREFLQSLLDQHKRNLRRLMQQKAQFGSGEEPLRLLNQIDAEEEEIARIKQQLG